MTRVYVGTYTKHGTSEGIYVYDLNRATGALEHVQTVGGVGDPAYLNFGPGGRVLYAVNERGEDGGVSAFSVDQPTGQLTFVNREASQGADPAHLSVQPSGNALLVDDCRPALAHATWHLAPTANTPTSLASSTRR